MDRTDHRMRWSLAAVAIFAAGIAMSATGLLSGWPGLLADAAGFACLIQRMGWWRALAEKTLRAITGRRKSDYARIRQLEIECGLTEAPARAKVSGLAFTTAPFRGVTMAEFGAGLERLMTLRDYAASGPVRAYGQTWHNGELQWDSTTTEGDCNGTSNQ